METRANYIAVGIFTVVAIVAAFAFVYWTARLGSSGDTDQVNPPVSNLRNFHHRGTETQRTPNPIHRKSDSVSLCLCGENSG